MKYTKKIEKELEDLDEGWIVLIETKSENSVEVGLAAIKFLTKKDYKGIIISANRPCENLLDLYEDNKINTDKVLILDLVCKSQNIEHKEKGNVIHLKDISALTDISISLTEAIKSIKGNKFIFIDSITTMLIHNEARVFTKFLHSVLNKMRMKEIAGLLVSLSEDTDNEVRAEIAQLCDKVIKI